MLLKQFAPLLLLCCGLAIPGCTLENAIGSDSSSSSNNDGGEDQTELVLDESLTCVFPEEGCFVGCASPVILPQEDDIALEAREGCSVYKEKDGWYVTPDRLRGSMLRVVCGSRYNDIVFNSRYKDEITSEHIILSVNENVISHVTITVKASVSNPYVEADAFLSGQVALDNGLLYPKFEPIPFDIRYNAGPTVILEDTKTFLSKNLNTLGLTRVLLYMDENPDHLYVLSESSSAQSELIIRGPVKDETPSDSDGTDGFLVGENEGLGSGDDLDSQEACAN